MKTLKRLQNLNEKISNIILPMNVFLNSMDTDLIRLINYELNIEDEYDFSYLLWEINKGFNNKNRKKKKTFDKILLNSKNINRRNSIEKIILKLSEKNSFFFQLIKFENTESEDSIFYESIFNYTVYKYISDVYLLNKTEEKIPLTKLEEIIENIEKRENNINKLIAYYCLLDTINFFNTEDIENEPVFKKIFENVNILLLDIIILFQKELINSGKNIVEFTMERDLLKDEVKQYKSVLSEVNKEKELLESQLQDKNEENSIDLINGIKKELKGMTEKIQSYNVDVLKKSYESIIKRNTQEITDLKVSLKMLDLKKRKVEEEFKEFKNSINDNYILEYIERSRNKGLLEKLSDKVKEYSSNQITDFNNEFERDINKKNDNYIIDSRKNNNQLIGYVTIEDNIHYVNYPNLVKIQLLDIPEKALLGEYQFIVTNENYKFLYSLRHHCKNDIPPQNSILAVIKEEEGELVAFTNNKKIKIDNTLGFQINEPMVGVINKNKIKKLFKSILFNADYFLKSIKAKGLSAHYIYKIENDNLFIRDIETGIEQIKKKDKDVNIEDIILIDKNTNIFKAISNYKFYISSSYYNNYEIGTVIRKNNKFYFNDIYKNKLSALENNCSLHEGDVVKIDEFNRIIEVIEHEYIQNKKCEKRNYTKKNKEKIKEKNKIDIKENILIIGDLSLQQSYKLTFLKKGYEATVISGFESYNKVYREAKKADRIIITEEFVDHNIMWELKKQYNNILYAKSKGANSMLEQLENNIIGRKQLELN